MKVDTEQLFDRARTHNGFTAEPVSDDQLHRLYDLMKWAPTSANSSPARILFVRSAAAKERLLGCVSPGNVEKTRAAPVTAIIGMDLAFYEKLPFLFPHTDAKSWFVGIEEKGGRSTDDLLRRVSVWSTQGAGTPLDLCAFCLEYAKPGFTSKSWE